jgi:hypothetical protein
MKKSFSAVKDEIEALAPLAVETAKKIMLDKGVKASTRLAAAHLFIEHTVGKATQPVEHQGNLLPELLTRLTPEGDKVARDRFVASILREPIDDVS